MRAMILAAGKGERMRPLTDNIPKPLLTVHGKPLLQHHIEALVAASITEIVINTGIHGDQIESCFGSGSHYGATIRYSHEGDVPRETGGGIRLALSLLGNSPFVIVNGDIRTTFKMDTLPDSLDTALAWLVLVDNPAHHPQGDFALAGDQVTEDNGITLTYSGIGVLDPELFANETLETFSLAPLLRTAIRTGRVRGARFGGYWRDIGTPERLEEANRSKP